MSGVVVVKLGGRALDAPQAVDELAQELAGLEGRAVLVHGGGPEVSAWSERLGLSPSFVDGRRVTDAPTLEVAAAVLAGLANKRLVARLLAHGVRAVGLAALDGGLARVEPRADAARLGAVGQVVSIDAGWLASLLARRLVPVIAPIGAHGGELLNVNADDLAAALAAALGGASLVLLSDVEGLKLEGRVVTALDLPGVERALASGEVSGGMVPKLAAARTAVEGGARAAWIGTWSGPGTLSRAAQGGGAGTRVTAAAREEARS